MATAGEIGSNPNSEGLVAQGSGVFRSYPVLSGVCDPGVPGASPRLGRLQQRCPGPAAAVRTVDNHGRHLKPVQPCSRVSCAAAFGTGGSILARSQPIT